MQCLSPSAHFFNRRPARDGLLLVTRAGRKNDDGHRRLQRGRCFNDKDNDVNAPFQISRNGYIRQQMEAIFNNSDHIQAPDLVKSVVRKWGNISSFELVVRNGTVHLDVLPVADDDTIDGDAYMANVVAVVTYLNECGLGFRVMQRIADVPVGIEPYMTATKTMIPVSFDLAISSDYYRKV